MRVHPPPFLQAHHSIRTACPVALEIPRNGSKIAFVSSKVEVAGLCCNKTRNRPAQYSQVLERDHLSQAHKNAWNSYSHSSRVKLWAKFTRGSLALATVHYTKWKLTTVTKQTDPRCPQWQLSTLFLQLSFYLAEILVGIAEELMF